jgi:Phosphotransacetylase
LKVVSSFFLIAVPGSALGEQGAFIFADCGVVINPTAVELAEIAIASADSARALFEVQARVAMLSFSTKGSASHPLVDKVAEAVRTVCARAPEILIDGELQVDAAIISAIADSKAPGSQVAGRANTLIFLTSKRATSHTSLSND